MNRRAGERFSSPDQLTQGNGPQRFQLDTSKPAPGPVEKTNSLQLDLPKGSRMSGRNHPEYREQLQTKNPAESTASKIPSSGDHPDFHDPSYSPPGKTRLDLGKQPMKLGKKATDPGNSRHLGHPALKNRANPGNLPVGLIRGINWTQGPQKAKTPQRPNTGRQRYRATNGKKTGSQAATMLRRPASSADESAASYGPA